MRVALFRAPSRPRLTANVYSRVDVNDPRAGLNRIHSPPIPTLAAASTASPLVPVVPPRAPLRKRKGRGSTEKVSQTAALEWSGRLDLNPRPLAPQSSLRIVQTVAALCNCL